ncbi:GNAT family N-acetyltransferase [Klebsiella variicola subsp. variicola]|nr:GNAT family N-acetyltransferase [Klebsiella variicola subsp. variicola]
MDLNFRIAIENDSEEIASLVNRAYRPGETGAGWTHESNLVAGIRISTEQVISLFTDNSAILLLCTESKIVACVHVQGGDLNAYIVMLAADPRQQASGIGKKMLNHAEQYAKVNFGSVIFNMSVLSSRPELLSFYERRGYVLTGKVGEYPISAGVGKPIVDEIKVLFLEKKLQ